MKFFLTSFLFCLSLVTTATASTSTVKSGTIGGAAPTANAPMWGKLVMSGNTVTCYYALGAATPKTWTKLGSAVTVNFQNNPLLIGMFITSNNTAAVSSGTIDNFSITPTPNYRLQDIDIGAPSLMGSANLIDGVWKLSGCGSNVWATFDQCNFQPWLVWGDCTVICRITGLGAGSYYQKIGIMIRDGYNSGSDNAAFYATYGNGTVFQYRQDFQVNPDGATVATLVAPTSQANGSGTAVGVNPIGSSSAYFVLRP